MKLLSYPFRFAAEGIWLARAAVGAAESLALLAAVPIAGALDDALSDDETLDFT